MALKARRKPPNRTPEGIDKERQRLLAKSRLRAEQRALEREKKKANESAAEAERKAQQRKERGIALTEARLRKLGYDSHTTRTSRAVIKRNREFQKLALGWPAP